MAEKTEAPAGNAGETAPAGAPAAGAAATPPKPPAPPPPKKPPAPPAKDDPDVIKVKAKEFMKRVRQTSEKDVMAKLGCTLEEAKARLDAAAAGNTVAAGPVATAASDAELKKLKIEAERLATENRNLKQSATTGHAKLKGRVQELEDELQMERVRGKATALGFTDVGYAVYKFTEAAAASETELDPGAFFETLKTENPALVVQPAGATAPATPPAPRKVAAASAPPAAGTPGGVPPDPKTAPPVPANGSGGEKSVDDMTREEFADYSQRTFGYRPGR